MTNQYTLDHVQITVPLGAEAAAIEFYSHILGLAELPQPDLQAAQGGAWYATGNAQLHLKPENVGKDALLASKRHVCLRTNDLDSLKTRLLSAGVDILPDERPIPGVQRIFVRDPGGNRLELMQRD